MPENDETTQPIGTEHLREVLKQLEESRIDALRWEAESHKNRADKLEVTIEGMQWRERYHQLRANGPTKIVEHVPEAKAPNWAAYSSETDNPDVLISELRATLGAVRAQRDSYKTRSENLRQRAEAMHEPLRAFEADESVWKDRAEDLAERIKVAHARHGNYADRSNSLGYLADLATKRVKEWRKDGQATDH